jgi:hypothetical protein
MKSERRTENKRDSFLNSIVVLPTLIMDIQFLGATEINVFTYNPKYNDNWVWENYEESNQIQWNFDNLVFGLSEHSDYCI